MELESDGDIIVIGALGTVTKGLGQRETQHRKRIVITRRQNQCRGNKVNYDWKEEYVTISQEPRLIKHRDKNQRDKRIIIKYLNIKYL